MVDPAQLIVQDSDLGEQVKEEEEEEEEEESSLCLFQWQWAWLPVWCC